MKVAFRSLNNMKMKGNQILWNEDKKSHHKPHVYLAQNIILSHGKVLTITALGITAHLVGFQKSQFLCFCYFEDMQCWGQGRLTCNICKSLKPSIWPSCRLGTMLSDSFRFSGKYTMKYIFHYSRCSAISNFQKQRSKVKSRQIILKLANKN